MEQESYSPRRIARNTGYLYLRMVLLTAAELVSVRLALSALGMEGYELFAAVAGVVSTLRFLNGKLEETGLRFLSLALGHPEDLRKAFAGNLLLTLALMAGMVVLGETAFFWFVGAHLSLPAGLESEALPVFHFGVAVACLRTLRLPFSSLVVAEEKMGFLAGVSLFEALLMLAAAGGAGLWMSGGPTAYAVLLLLAEVLLLAVFALRCRAVWMGPRELVANGLKGRGLQGAFFSWSSLSSLAHVLKYQGVCLLLTQLAGVAYAATWRVSMGLGFGLYGVIGNFQQAYAPQFVKLWGCGRFVLFRRLLMRTLLWSFALMALVSVPLIIWTEGVVGVWLGEKAPPGCVAFLRCVLAHFLVDSLAAPLHSAIVATGRIVRYQICVSLVMGSGFVLAAVALALRLPPWSALAAVAFTNALAVLYRAVYVRRFVLSR